MSSSRDFGFTTLRSIQAYQPNGARVPPNYLLSVGADGAGTFTNTVYVSSIHVSSAFVSTICARTILDVSTIDVSTINASTIDTSNLNVSSLNASSIITNYLTVNSTLNASTIDANTVYASTLYTNLIARDGSNIIAFDAGGPEYIYMASDATSNNINLVGGVSILGREGTSGADLYLNASTSTGGLTYNNIFMNNPTTISINQSTTRSGLTLYNSNTSQLNQPDGSSGISFVMSTNAGKYTWFNTFSTSGVGDGLIKDHLQLYSYFPGPSSILDIAPTGNVNITNSLTVPYISTNVMILVDGNASTLEVTNIGSTMYVDGQPIITDGTISTVSTVFWNEVSGALYNKNAGIGTTKYQVGVGTNGAALNATLDVLYTGTGAGNVFNLKNATGNLLTVSNNGSTIINGCVNILSTLNVASEGNFTSTSGLTNGTIGLKPDGDNGNVIRFGGTGPNADNLIFRGSGDFERMRINGDSTSINNPLLVVPNTYGTYSTSLGINVQDGNFAVIEAFSTNSISDKKDLLLNAYGGNVGIGIATNPQFTLDVNGNIRASGYLSTNTIEMNNGNIELNNGNIYNVSSINNSNGAPLDLVDTAITVYNGNITIASNNYYLSTNLINMTLGQIDGLSTINGLAYPPIDDALWSKSGNDIYNDNTGFVGIGTSIPTERLTVDGTILITSSNTTLSRFTYQGGDSFIESANTLYFTSINAISTAMVVQPNSRRVGINTQTPQETLDVNGNIIANVSISDTKAGIIISSIESGADSKLSMGFYNNGTIFPSLQSYRASDLLAENVYINPSGGNVIIAQNTAPVITTINGGTINVGATTTTSIINITAVNTLINGGASITGPSFYFSSINPTSQDTFKLELAGANLLAYKSTVNGQAATFLQNDGGGQLVLATSQPTIFIDGGNVGINTSTPQDTLDINGNTYVNGILNASTINLNSTTTVQYQNYNPADSNNIYYYKYDIASQGAINGGGTPPPNWNNGTEVLITPGTGYKSTLINTSGVPNTRWICPKSGLWTVTCNIVDNIQTADHLVMGNITTNEPIVTNGNSASVYISVGDNIYTCGYFGGFSNIGGGSSYISLRLLMPLNINI